jgi:hypothetical protein
LIYRYFSNAGRQPDRAARNKLPRRFVFKYILMNTPCSEAARNAINSDLGSYNILFMTLRPRVCRKAAFYCIS